MIHICCLVTGQFGFQKDVNAMASIEKEAEGVREVSEIDCLLGATMEIEKTVTQPLRLIDPFKSADRRQGQFLISQFRVRCPLPNIAVTIYVVMT